jgi:hypothetical protein
VSRHPVEALLRPPVELWSTLVALATALIAMLAPWSLMMMLATCVIHPFTLLVCGSATPRIGNRDEAR